VEIVDTVEFGYSSAIMLVFEVYSKSVWKMHKNLEAYFQ
jgi:hypothetical protein